MSGRGHGRTIAIQAGGHACLIQTARKYRVADCAGTTKVVHGPARVGAVFVEGEVVHREGAATFVDATPLIGLIVGEGDVFEVSGAPLDEHPRADAGDCVTAEGGRVYGERAVGLCDASPAQRLVVDEVGVVYDDGAPIIIDTAAVTVGGVAPEVGTVNVERAFVVNRTAVRRSVIADKKAAVDRGAGLIVHVQRPAGPRVAILQSDIVESQIACVVDEKDLPEIVTTEGDFSTPVNDDSLVRGIGVDYDFDNARPAVEVDRAAERDRTAEVVRGVLRLTTCGSAVADGGVLGLRERGGITWSDE